MPRDPGPRAARDRPDEAVAVVGPILAFGIHSPLGGACLLRRRRH